MPYLLRLRLRHLWIPSKMVSSKVSPLQSRRFPKRPKHQVVVEAKFDGELLTTDPVQHECTPDFNQELAWEVDSKSLHRHRLQRASIKVICYATDASCTAKEQVGYIVLDLRAAQPKQTNKWYQLLNTKYTKSKPDIFLGLYVVEDTGTARGSPATELSTQSFVVPEKSPAASSLHPRLDEAQGLYQIGPPASCTDHFLLSVTIAFAKNLSQLIPTSIPLPSSSFFFYFSLFGNNVTNEVFHDLLNPNFPVERSSVKVNSSVKTLTKFFSSQPGLQTLEGRARTDNCTNSTDVTHGGENSNMTRHAAHFILGVKERNCLTQVHLCCGDQSLGSCEVPLSSLLKPGSTEIFMQPVTVDGTYRLVPPNKVKQQLPPFTDDTAPVVGITVVLKKEDVVVKSSPVAVKDNLDGSYLSISPDKKLAKSTTEEVKKPSEKTEKPKKPAVVEANHVVDHTTLVNGDSGKIADTGMEVEPETTHTTVTSLVKPASQNLIPNIPAPDPSPQPHHFTFSVDLRSVRDISTEATLNVFLRYTYPFFGSDTPIATHPPTPITPGQELLLPQSFCAFDFACSLQQLHDTFMRVPLVVELWNKDLTVGKDILLGTSQLPLSLVLSAQKSRLMNNGQTGVRQVHSDRLPINSLNREGSTSCGEVTFVLSLEDWGPMDASVVNGHSAGQKSDQKVEESSATNARETAEYQAALELELWKETQQQMFEAQLKQKESLYMRALADEWKRRDKEREIIVMKKTAEYSQLEEQLRKTIADLEKREKQLSHNEQEVSRLRKDLQHEHERQLQEMREASRRMKDDCDHQVSAERSKIAELEASIARHKNEVLDVLHKHELLDKEFMLYKEQQAHTPEVRLQSEISLLTIEKTELERKLDTAVKSRVHYKQQWSRALKELGRLKQQEQEVAKAQLKRQQEELEQMRLRYLAAEEKVGIGGERRELEDIKSQLNRLRDIEAQKTQTEEQLRSPAGDAHNSPREVPTLNTSEERMARLIEERDTLLRTGVYTSQDPIIAKLERQIRESISNTT